MSWTAFVQICGLMILFTICAVIVRACWREM